MSRIVDRLRAMLARVTKRRPGDRLDDETRSFVDLLTDEKIAAGATPADARRLALLEIGGIEQLKETVRDSAPGRFADRLRQDIGYGMRLARRAPGLNAAIVAVLGLGIGAISATFAVVDAVLLQPLDYADAGRLVTVLHGGIRPVSPANFLDWQRQMPEFEAMGAAEYWTPNATGAGDPERLYALHVTPEILPMLGVAPASGRFPQAGTAVREVAIGDGLWRRLFGADPQVLGRTLTLDGTPHVVVAVMPPAFQFAPFWATRAELWAPVDLRERATQRRAESLRVFARLTAGTSLAQARQSMAALTARLEEQFPGTNRDVTVTPLKEMVVGDVREPIALLFAAVAVVLLVACANVAHMLLARASTREAEVAMRAALGAGRLRLVRQFVTESLLLAVAGGAAGLLLARLAIDLIRSLGSPIVPRLSWVALDSSVVAFASGVSLMTVLVFGLVPALRLANPSLTTIFRGGERGGRSRRSSRLSRLLVGSEIALSVMLLVAAGLLLRSYVALSANDPGFTPERLLSLVVSVRGTADAAPERRIAFYQDLLDRFRALPDVQSASAINHAPLVGDIWGLPFLVEHRPEPRAGESLTATYRVVLPEYFRTMQRRVVHGRDFTPADNGQATPVVIVNQFMADTYWPGQDPIGQRLRLATQTDGEWRTVVGVAGHAVRSGWQDLPDEEVFLPLLQTARYRAAGGHVEYLTFVLRTRGDPAASVAAARAAVRELAPAAPVSEVSVMSDVVSQALAGPRFILALLAGFALLTMVLSTVAVYGVMSHTVADRRGEIAIRLALGARRSRLLVAIVGDGLIITTAGAGAGLAAAALAAPALRGWLFGVEVFDPPTFLIVPLALVGAAIAGCLLPAWRASRIDPAREMRA